MAEALLEVATEYRVARVFGGKELVGTREDATAAFAKTTRDFMAAAGSLNEKVWVFAKSIGASFPKKGGKKPTQLSAATKILWFSGQHDVRIFDDFAYKALFGKKHYGELLESEWISFGSVWNHQYEAARLDVEYAVDQLRQDVGAILDWSLASENRAAAIAAMGENWFAHRVFDKFLWLKGASWKPKPRRSR